MNTLRRSIAVLSFLCLAAGTPGHSAKKPSPILKSWNERIQEVVELLHQGESVPAGVITTKLLLEMQQAVVPGAGAGRAFGMALMLQALAEAGMQNERDAAWHWQVAQQFDPDLEKWDLREFGAASGVLARHTRTADPVPDLPRLGTPAAQEISRPEMISRSNDPPQPSDTTRRRRGDDLVLLQLVIDEQGVASHPQLLRWPGDLSFALSSCEWARGLSFRPATKGGEPVAVIYALSASYRSK